MEPSSPSSNVTPDGRANGRAWAASGAGTGDGTTGAAGDIDHVLAGKSRDWLDGAHRGLLRRLHGRSDDFEATRMLRHVSAALRALPDGPPTIPGT